MPRLRALVVLPTRDLAAQVFKVFATLAPAVGLRVGLAAAAAPLAAEAAVLAVAGFPGLGSDAGGAARAAGGLGFAEGVLLGGQQPGLGLGPGRGGGGGVDVLVATPGRLMAHLRGTPGVTLEHLRFLARPRAARPAGASAGWAARRGHTSWQAAGTRDALAWGALPRCTAAPCPRFPTLEEAGRKEAGAKPVRRKQHACTAHVACMAASLARHTGSLRSVQPRPASRRARRCATSPRSLVAQVVDETDRLLRQSYQNWLPHVVAAAARVPPAAGLPAAAAAACSGALPVPAPV